MSASKRSGGVEPTPAALEPACPGREAVSQAEVRELAARFESMLLLQMIRDMRQAGKWEDESEEAGGLGADTYFETLDVELANHLTSARGLGLSAQLIDAFAKTSTKVVSAQAVSSPPPATADASHAAGQHRSVDGVALQNGSGVQPGIPPLAFTAAPGPVTSAYGWRRDPFTGQVKFHKGIDLHATYGQDVQAAGPGRVSFSGEQKGYGTTVVVKHANGVQTKYAHLSATTVQAGDGVVSGQVIGRAGRSGRATGTHLHFEVTVNGRHVAPSDAGVVAPHLRAADEQD